MPPGTPSNYSMTDAPESKESSPCLTFRVRSLAGIVLNIFSDLSFYDIIIVSDLHNTIALDTDFGIRATVIECDIQLHI